MEFAKDKRREKCPVCALSDEVRQQLREASNKKINRDTVVEWLSSDYKAKVSAEDITSHLNSRHDA